MNKKVAHITAAACLCAVSCQVSAASDTVVVTATRTAQTADETIAPVTVINRKDIEQSTARDLRELLTASVGVDFNSNGPYGKTNGLFLRGTNSDHLLTLVDGVKLSSATLGTTQFQFLPLDQIERIEIVRGPRASLYGSDAIGGVIQIFTRKGQPGSHYNASIGGGSDSTIEVSAGTGGGTEATTYIAQVAHSDTNGINVRDDSNPDDDGYDNTSLSASVSHRFSDTVSVDVNLLHAEGTNQFDNQFDPVTAVHEDDFTQQVLSGILNVIVSESLSLNIQAAQSRDESVNFTDGALFSEFNTTHSELSVQADYVVGEVHLLSVGADYDDDEVDGSTSYDEDSRDNLGIFAQWQGDYGQHGVVFGLRSDDNQQFGTETTGSLDYRYALNDSVNVIAGAGTGFKAPSFNELYFPAFGNPDLLPEESVSYEFGLTGSHEKRSWSARVFHTEIDNLINFDPLTFIPVNIDQAGIDGIELEYYVSVAQWLIGANLTLLDAEDDATGNVLPRRAERSIRISAGRQFGSYHVGAEIISQGRRFDDPQNTIKLDGYEIVNARAGYQIREGLRLSLDIENIFDEDYQTVDGYNQKGISGYLQLGFNGGN